MVPGQGSGWEEESEEEKEEEEEAGLLIWQSLVPCGCCLRSTHVGFLGDSFRIRRRQWDTCYFLFMEAFVLGSCDRFSSCSPVLFLPRRVQELDLVPRSCRQRHWYASAGFAGVDALRAVFPFFPYTAHCLVLSGTCYASVYGVVEFHVFYVNMWTPDPEVESRHSGHVLWPLVTNSHLYGVRCSPVENQTTDFPEITLGIIYVFNAHSGYMLVSVYEAFGMDFTRLIRESGRSCSSRVQTWRRLPSSHSCSSFEFWTVVCMPVVCNDRCCVVDDVAQFIDGGGRRCVAAATSFSCRS